MKNTMMMKLATASTLLLAAALPAGAQSEISPDHFAENSSINAPVQAGLQPPDAVKAQMAAEQARLNGYESQISEKEQQAQADYQAAISTYPGDEAGQMIAYNLHQRECEQLKQALAANIREARENLARLDNMSTVARTTPAMRASKPRAGKAEPMLIATAHPAH